MSKIELEQRMFEHPFPYRKRLHKLAAWVLFAWLLSISAGLAHACGLTPDGEALGIDADVHAASAIAISSELGEAGLTPDDDPVSCMKHCAEAKAVNSAAESDSDAPAPALPLHVVNWHARAALVACNERMAFTPAPAAAPAASIVIEFLRLAL